MPAERGTGSRALARAVWQAVWQAAVLAGTVLLLARTVFTALEPGPVLGLALLGTATVQVLLHLPDSPSLAPVRRPVVPAETVLVAVGTGAVERGLDALPAFERRLRPRLVVLTDDRLLRSHGVDRTRRPEQARRLVGEDLWQLLEHPAQELPEPAAVAALLDRIEAL